MNVCQEGFDKTIDLCKNICHQINTDSHKNNEFWRIFIMSNKLSRLEEVELREVWPDEAQDFTPWLAEEENLGLLGETLGLELELVAREIQVGDYRADILCKNEDGSRVLIENQLEKTDHRHLGQILTYSAGLDVLTVIWVAKQFEKDHRAALII